MANEFSIKVNTIADTSKLQSQLNKSSKELKINARLNIDTSTVDQSIAKFKKINNATTGDMFKKVSQSFKDVEYNGKQAIKMIEKFQDALGNTKTRTSILEQGVGKHIDSFKLLESNITSATSKFKPFEEQLTSTTKEISKEYGTVIENGNAYKATITTTTNTMENYGGTVNKLKTVVTEYSDEQGRQIKLTQQLDEKNKQVGTTTKEITNDMTNLEKQNKKVGQSFTDVIQKVAKFYLASLPIRAVQKAITEVTQTIKDYDKAVTEMDKVTSLSGEELDKYTQKLGELGAEVGRTRTTMTELATGFLKAGYSEEDSARLAEYGALLQNTADEELEASEATSVIVSALKAFSLEASDTIRVLDDINIVSQDFAVSSADISRGLTQAGASMATYGNSLEETIGLITAGTEIFQGKSQQVARGLNTIASRVAKNEDELAKYGVRTKDMNGNLRSTYDILSDLSTKWVDMSNSEKISLGTTLAGVNQYKVFSAIMTNFSKAIESTNEQMTISGTTMKQNEIYMDSLEARIQLLKAEIEKLITSGDLLLNLGKASITIMTSLFKILNTPFSKTLISVTALIMSLKALNVVLAKGISLSGTYTITQGLEAVATYGLSGAFQMLALSIKETTVALMASPLFLPAVAIMAISAIVTVISTLNVTLSEHQEKLKDIKQEYSDNKTELEDTEEKLENVIKKINELNSLSTPTLADTKQLNLLRLEREELEQQVRLLKEKNAQKQKEYAEEAKATVYKKTYDEDVTSIEQSNQIIFKKLFGEADRVQYLKQYSSEMIEQGKIIDDLSSKKERYGNLSKDEQKQLDYAIARYGFVSSKANEYASALEEETSMLSDSNKTRKYVLDGMEDYNDALKERSECVSEATGLQGLYIEETEDEIEAVEELSKELEKLISKYGIANIELDKLKQTFETLDELTKELNSEQGLTVETYEQLMTMGSAYVAVLFDENGQLRDNIDARKQLYKLKIQQLALDEVNNLIQVAQAYADGSITLKEYNNALGNNVSLEWQSAYAKVMGMDIDVKEKEALLKKIQTMQKWANEAVKNIDIMTDSTKATKAQTDALKDQKSAYEEAIKYIKSQYDDMINSLKDEKESAVDLIQKQIDARKEQKEQEIQAIEDEIDALEKEKDAREEYWDSQIDALKEANEQRKDALELQEKLEAFAKAKAKKVMVYKEGQGFVYDEDESEVSKAQTELNKYLSEQAYENELERLTKLKESEMKNYEDRLKALKEFKESKQRSYDEEIENLEKYKKSVEENYDAQIKVYQNYKEEFEKMVSAYEDNQSKLLVQQLTGIDLENKNWMTRLDNLKNFVAEYHKLLAQVDSSSGGSGTGDGSGNGDEDGKNDEKNKNHITPTKNNIEKDNDNNPNKTVYYKWCIIRNSDNKMVAGWFDSEYEANEYAKKNDDFRYFSWKAKKMQAGYKYATGVSSIKDDQIAVVGDAPNSELVVGSKLNNDQGVIMGLSKGSGVVNAKSTSTLAGIFNSLSGSSSNAVERNITNNNGQNISIGNISLPEVKNGKDFVDYLQNFSLDMKQMTFART